MSDIKGKIQLFYYDHGMKKCNETSWGKGDFDKDLEIAITWLQQGDMLVLY